NEAQGATAIYDQKLRIIADAEVRNCTKEHISRILDATLGQKPQTSQHQRDTEPLNAEKIKAIAAQDQKAIGPADPEGLRITAAALAQGGAEGFRWSATNGRDVAAGNSLIDEYNQLVQRAKSLFQTDPYIQSLQEISKEKHPEVAARTVKR